MCLQRESIFSPPSARVFAMRVDEGVPGGPQGAV